MTLTHTGYAPAELQRTAPLGVFTMTYSAINFATTLTAPTAVSAVATRTVARHATTHLRRHVGGAPTASTVGGVIVGVLQQQPVRHRGLHTLTFTPPGGITRLNIYKQSNGLWAYLGQSGDGTFVDDNIAARPGQDCADQRQPVHGCRRLPGPLLLLRAAPVVRWVD